MKHTQMFGRILVALLLLFSGVFFAFVTATGDGISIYSSSTTDYSVGFPEWNQSGAIFNGTEESGNSLEITSADAGTYTYTSPIIEGERLIQLSDFRYSATIREDQGQEIIVKVYTSDDNFKSIENSQTFQLKDGAGSKVMDLRRSKDYRIQVLMSYSGSGTEPVLSSLSFSGVSVSKDYDFTPVFVFIAFWMLIISAIFAAIPKP